MKKLLALVLTVCLLLGLCACNSGSAPTESTAPTQSEEEASVEKILIIGNSHSGDTFWLLQRVFDAHYDKDVTLGYLYYSGCTIIKHLKFAQNNEAVYAYRRNYTGKPNGAWDDIKDVTLQFALQDQQWDVIVFQADEADRREPRLNETQRRQLEAYVEQYVPQPHVFMWNTTWPDAGDGPVYDPSWPAQPPAGYSDRLMKKYGWDVEVHLNDMLSKARDFILTDDAYEKAICPGSAVMYAILVLERPQTDIYRDYTHLTEFGRLIAAYAFYTQYTGQMVDEVRIDVVPQHMRSSRYRNAGDVIVTQEMKDVILECAGYAFAHPYDMPTK